MCSESSQKTDLQIDIYLYPGNSMREGKEDLDIMSDLRNSWARITQSLINQWRRQHQSPSWKRPSFFASNIHRQRRWSLFNPCSFIYREEPTFYLREVSFRNTRRSSQAMKLSMFFPRMKRRKHHADYSIQLQIGLAYKPLPAVY